MRLQGDANNLHGFEVDSRVYLLMKKLAFWRKIYQVWSKPPLFKNSAQKEHMDAQIQLFSWTT